jgi:hypothetical protein
MPAKDLYHEAVKYALIQAGWEITADPLFIKYGKDTLLIDLAAHRLIAATRGQEKIAIEVKSFTASSDVTEFHASLGQFLNYRMALNKTEPERKLILAVPEEAYKRFFTRELARDSLLLYQVPLLVFDRDQKEIVLWT